MADGSTQSKQVVATRGSEHGLWIHGGNVLSVTLDRESKGFPPDLKCCGSLNRTIQGLARAIQSVVYHAESQGSELPVDGEFLMQPVEDLTDAIVLLSQLSDAIVHEVTRAGGREA